MHGEPLRADHSELLVLVVKPIEEFLEVHGLQVNREGMYWDTPVTKDLNRCDSVSDGDLERSA